MKIYITGSTGMVGKNILEHPDINKYEIINTNRSELNLLDFVAVRTYLNDNKPDMIIHCAGKVGGIQANMKDLYGFLTDNLLMGMNLVRAAKEVGIKRFLNLSSSCSYPRDAKNPLSEDLILKGELEPTNEGYAIAKVAILKMCEYLTKEHPEFQYKTLVPCNLYGRWDKFDPKHSHMLPAVIRKIHEAKINGDKEVEIWGDGLAKREFMFAGDLANCIAKAISDFDLLPNVMNTGLGHDYTINEYYEIIAKVVGFNGEFKHDLTKPIGMKQKLLDVTKQTQWGWEPKYSLEEGIKKTYEFYLEKEYVNV